jgi:hypothetical protein
MYTAKLINMSEKDGRYEQFVSAKVENATKEQLLETLNNWVLTELDKQVWFVVEVLKDGKLYAWLGGHLGDLVSCNSNFLVIGWEVLERIKKRAEGAACLSTK